MAGRSSEFPTLFEIMSAVHTSSNSRVVATDGHKIATFPRREGTVMLSPDQLLGVRVPVQRVTAGGIRGYQQHFRALKAREIARFLQQFSDASYVKVMPVIEISIDGDFAYYTDGQHRAGGGVIANVPMRCLVTKRTLAEARKLFALQGKATPPNRNVLIFDSDEPIDEYIQDAVTSGHDHPWASMITTSTYGPTNTRLSASTVKSLLKRFLGVYTTGMQIDRQGADELAALVSAFGTKQINPSAFRTKPLHAIAMVGRAVFRDRTPHPRDRDRWATHMPKFNFTVIEYLPSSEIAFRLLAHWNKGLTDDRRASL